VQRVNLLEGGHDFPDERLWRADPGDPRHS